jgi:general stress protein 26
MLTTRFAGGLRARPLDARPDRKAGVIFFVIDVRGLKDDEVKTSPEVCFTVIDADAKAYLSITGHADIVRDAAIAKRIWKSPDQVWWPDGPEDVNVRVLRLDPTMAELWDGPASSAVSLATNRILAKTARSPLISKGDYSENVSQLSSQTKNTKSNSYCLVAFRADPIAAKVTRLAALANCPAPPVR